MVMIEFGSLLFMHAIYFCDYKAMMYASLIFLQRLKYSIDTQMYDA